MNVTDNHRLQLMQEALDDVLTPEQQRELERILEHEPAAVREYDKLQQVENLLQTAPHERAPERLAMTIMARLGQTIMEMQAQADPEQDPELTEATMRVAIALVTVATLPLMVGASWMLLNAMTHPEAFEAVLAQVAALFMMVINVLEVMLEEAQAIYKSNPEVAMALLALIPLTLLALVKQVMGIDDDDDGEDENHR